ncbi:MAG: DUF86 domain-containing protein [Coprothermobacterota bacterium]|nr:DUF86 domain-containing protein [Coprothermobacterota bacterium]
MDRDWAYLLDILQAAKLAVSYLENVGEERFLRDTQRQDSVIRRIEIIGEAARRISPKMREACPDIPWDAMIGMRNLMIHDYDDVDLQVVWRTVQHDLPSLIVRLEPLLPAEEA